MPLYCVSKTMRHALAIIGIVLVCLAANSPKKITERSSPGAQDTSERLRVPRIKSVPELCCEK